jgi:hypothetical protein
LGLGAWQIGGSTGGGQNAIMMVKKESGGGSGVGGAQVRSGCFINENLPPSSLAREGEGKGGRGIIYAHKTKWGDVS